MRKIFLLGTLVLLGSVGLANANTLTGALWENEPGASGNATIANVPARAPDVTFSVNSPLNFLSGGAYTIGEFLTSGGATPLSGLGELGNTLNNTFFNFVGQVTVLNGQVFHAEHDDGMTLVINGITVINSPAPTSAIDTPFTWTGASGTYAFQLVYGETFGAPAALQIDLPLEDRPVPGPIVGAGLPGLVMAFGGLLAWRRRKSIAA